MTPRSFDRRLIEAFDLISEGRVRVLSLDVFGTLLWRKAPDDEAALEALEADLGRRDLLAADHDPALFVHQRGQAERQARAEGPFTLAAIYERIPAWVFAGVGEREAAARAELEHDQALWLPDLDAAALVAGARAAGVAVLAVAGSPHTEAELRSLLDRAPLRAEDVEVVAAPPEPADDVLHVPPLPRPAGLEAIMRRERGHGSRRRPGHDFGLSALRAKALEHPRQESLPESLQTYWRFGAAVVGPALTGFGEWVHARARAEGAGTVFCPMREGELLTRLIGEGAAWAPDPVAAGRIWLSRQVVSRANIVHGSREELLPVATTRRRPPTVAGLCATLGVDADSSRLLAEHAGSRLDDRRLAGRMLDELSGNPAVRGQIVAASELLRRRLVRYVERCVPDRDAPLVLVDLGWGGTIQGELERALAHEDVQRPVVGLYLITHDPAGPRVLDGARLHGFLAELGTPETDVHAILRSPEFLEQLCMPGHGSQVDLAADLTPVLADWSEPPEQPAQRAAVQDGILAFQALWGRHRAALGDRLGPMTEAARPLLLGTLSRAVTEPTYEEAAALGRWMHDENFGSTATESLVAGGPAAAVRYMDPHTLLNIPMNELYWPFGVAALHDEHLAAALTLVATGRLEPEAFSSVLETGDFSVHYDHGHGFGEEWKATVTPRRNRYGLSLVRATVSAGEIRRLRIDPAEAPCVLRLDWLALRCWVEDDPEPVQIRLAGPEELERLELLRCSWLAPGTLLARRRDPQLSLDLRSLVAARVYRVDVECAFAALAIAPPRSQPPAPPSAVRERLAEGKRMLRDVENRTGVPIGEPLRSAWRRRRATGR